jgi:MFS family permease
LARLWRYFRQFTGFPREVKLFLGAFALIQLNEGAFFTLLPLLLNGLGMPEDAIGTALASRFLCMALISLPAAALSQKFARKRLLMLGGVIFFISAICQVVFAATPLLYVFAGGMGIGGGFFLVNAAPFMHDYSSHETQPYVFGAFGALGPAMMFVGTTFGGSASDLIARALSGWIPLSQVSTAVFVHAYSIVLITCGALAGGCLLLAALIRDTAWRRSAEGYFTRILSLFSQRITWSQFTFTLVIGLGSGLVVPFFPIFLKVMLNVPASVVGVLQGVAMGSVSLGVLATPYLIARFGRVGTVVTSQAISLPFILGIAYAPFLVALGALPAVAIIATGAAFIIRNALMNLANPVNSQLLMDIYGDRQRMNIVAINMMTFPLGRAIGAQIGGNMMRHINYQSPYWATFFLYTFGILVYFLAYGALEREFQRRVSNGEDTTEGML